MELRQLKYFAKAAATLNFTDAAKAMNIAQSSLSQQIKQLEDELDTQLFLRSNHSIQLTEAGELILPFVLRTINDAEACVNRISDLRNLLTGSLDIGVTYSFGPILTETLIEFRKVYPNIKLNIVYKPMNELIELLASHKLDFALAFKTSEPIPNVDSHILFQSHLSAIVKSSHAIAQLDKITLVELAKYELALPSLGLQARNTFNHLVPSLSTFKISMELNEVNILLKLIRQTNLVTILADDSICNEQDIRAVRIDAPNNEMTGCVHILKDTYHKRSMKEFVRLLSESLAVKKRQFPWI